MTQLLLLGKDGQLGWELVRSLTSLVQVAAFGRQDLDLLDLDALQDALQQHEPQIIVNAAAYTDVDRAETETELARRINGEVPGILAQEAARLGSLLVHYSSDYVFDGEKGTPYTEEDRPNPVNRYGHSKLAGEREIRETEARYFILRSSWVYSTRRESFVTKVLGWARSKEILRIVDDQYGSPTWCRTLAEASTLMLAIALERGTDWAKQHSGTYHVTCRGSPSRFDLARAVLEIAPRSPEQTVPKVEPVGSEEFPTAAARPAYSALDSSLFESTFDLTLPPWREALALALDDPGSSL